MSRRFWILAATCAALTVGTWTPEQAQAGWRRRCCGRVYGCSWRGGYAWRGGWGGGYRGYGYGGYGRCSTGYGFGGNYLTGFGAPYGNPYASSWSMPYYANSWNVSPYLSGAYNTMPVASVSGFYPPSIVASQTVTAPPYPGDPAEVSSPSLGFAARLTAMINSTSTNTERAKAGTSFLARHGSGFGKASESSEGVINDVTPGYGYGYGVTSGSGFSYKGSVVNAHGDLSNFGLSSVAMNR